MTQAIAIWLAQAVARAIRRRAGTDIGNLPPAADGDTAGSSLNSFA